MIYLAGPYNDVDPKVMEERFEALTKKASELINAGEVVYSPITHNHPIAIRYGLPRGWEYWQKFDSFFVRSASKVIVLMLPGWLNSVGVAAEVQLAVDNFIPVEFLES